MLRVQFDNDSPYTVRIPRRYQRGKIITLAQMFVAYEQNLPLEQQTPYTASIAVLLDEVLTDRSTISEGEGRRLSASEEVKRADRQARALISRIAQVVRTAVYDTPVEAYKWGFRVRQSTGKLRQPRSRANRLALLDAYIAKEEGRAETERFTTPDLDQVKQVRDHLAANLAARNTAQTQRESGVAARNATSYALIEHIQAAVVYLVAGRFDFKLSPDLQHWGFEVVAKRSVNNGADEQVGEEAVTIEAIDQDDMATSNGVVYEAAQNGSYQPEPSVVNGSG